MKKRIIFIICILALTLPCAPITVLAEEVPKEYSSLLDGLDESVADELPQGIYSSDIDEVGEAVAQMSGVEYIFSFIGDAVGLKLSDSVKLLASLTGLLVLSAVFSAFRESLKSEALSRAIGFCSSCAVFSVVIVIIRADLLRVSEFFERISTLMIGMIPITGVLYAMGGNIATATASNAVMYAFLSFCENLCAKTVLPVSSLLVAFALCSAISPGINLRGLSGAVKKTYTFMLGFIMTVLLAVLSSQTVLSASADTITARAAKLVASTAIPIVGGSVGDTLRTVSSSVAYLKSICGISGIIFILILLLPTLISILLTRGVFLIAGAVADMLGCESEGKLIGELGGIYGTLAALTSMTSVMFIFALNIFVKCAVATG